MTFETLQQDLAVSEQIAALFIALPEFQLNVALRIAADVTAFRTGVTPRSVLDEFFTSTWTDEEWQEFVRPELERIFAEAESGGE